MGADAIQIAMQKGNINIGAHKRTFAMIAVLLSALITRMARFALRCEQRPR